MPCSPPATRSRRCGCAYQCARDRAAAAYAQRLQAMDVDAQAPEWPDHALRLDQGPRRKPCTGLERGRSLASVQDAAAQLATTALAPRDGERVLDMCSAPGGKSAAMLESAAIELTAVDNDARRLARVETGLLRLRLPRHRATLRAADAGDLDAWWDGEPFDAVLLDAPCSATGIVRRQPDIKWHRRESDVVELTATQDRLLDATWRVVRPGGRLLYTTCSILREENAGRIAAFLERTGGCGRNAAGCALRPRRAAGPPAAAGRGRHGRFLLRPAARSRQQLEPSAVCKTPGRCSWRRFAHARQSGIGFFRACIL